jgi:hypothetical protein
MAYGGFDDSLLFFFLILILLFCMGCGVFGFGGREYEDPVRVGC